MTYDMLNKAVWEQSTNVSGYTAAQGFLDDGERAIFAQIADSVRGQPILDLGVGGGRTVPILRPLSAEYVALDYAPAMVEACRRRFPDVDVREGDARDLGTFGDATFGLVMFSFNGIDAIDHDGRKRVMAEVQRVLRPGGLFWFSTLNLEGAGRRFSPWRPQWPRRDGGPLRFAVRALWTLARIPKLVRNRARLRRRFARGDGWCLDTLSAHDYRLLMHYTSLSRQLRELSEAGFLPDPVVLDSAYGKPVSPRDERRDAFWFQILARKAAPG